jgi:hypothetical protein
MTITSWQLNSASGRESVCWEIREFPTQRRSNALICDIHLAGQYFGVTLGGNASEPRDYTLVLRGLAVGVAEIERLATFLRSWLQLPIAEQARHPLALECKVGGLFDQDVIIVLGDRADTLAGGKPVVTFRYVTGRLRGELSFVTDQNCLQGLFEGIEAALAECRSSTHAS